MSVSAQVQVPLQPANGSSVERALGGSGLVAPHSCHDVSINVTGDATGGSATLIIHTDARWVSVFSMAKLVVSSNTATVNFMVDILGDAQVGGPSCTGVLPFDALLPSGSIATWVPQPYFGTSMANRTSAADPLRIRAVIPNVDTDVFFLNVRIFNFKKNVLEQTPLGVLASSMPRAASLT